MEKRPFGFAALACILLSSVGVQAAQPIIAPGQAFSLSENLPAGTLLGTVQASDPDGDPVFLFISGDATAEWSTQSVPFAIDPATRQLRTTRVLNFENRALWQLAIGATDGQGGAYPGTAETVEVTVHDIGYEPVIVAGGEGSFTPEADYIGTEATFTFGPDNQGTEDEWREIEYSFELPAGIQYLGATSDAGWSCGFASPRVFCTRDGMGVGQQAPFQVHVLRPSQPGWSQGFFPRIIANDYVHLDEWNGNWIDQLDAWPHPAPPDLRIQLQPSTATAASGESYKVSVAIDDLSNASMGALGVVTATLDLDPRWENVNLAGTDPVWSCLQDGTYLRCQHALLQRGTAAPAIELNMTAPAARGGYAIAVWISGIADLDTSNNVSRLDVLSQGRPDIANQDFTVPADARSGEGFGPVVASDDGWPVPANLTFSSTPDASVPFEIESSGVLRLTGQVVAGAVYQLPAQVADGGGLSDTATITVSVGPPSVPCSGIGDFDGDGLCNDADPDDDNDGQPDAIDPCPLDPQNACCGSTDTDSDGVGNACDADDDGDGLPDDNDPCPLDPSNTCACSANDPDSDGDGLCDSTDPDDDNDGENDGSDSCPLDPLNGCGCGAGQPDSDGDGLCNGNDEDDDGDGVPDVEDGCPLDPANTCGCPAGNPDSDGDGLCNAVDTDDDNDGTLDGADPCPLDPSDRCSCTVEDPDSDGDGMCDSVDTDIDGDGIPNGTDGCPLDPGNGCGCTSADPDTDGDGLCNSTDPDDDNDGTSDGSDPCPLDPDDLCGCPIGDPDSDADGMCNSADPDDDNDGIPDVNDACPLDASNGCVCGPSDPDTDGDGSCDSLDPDDDGDGVVDDDDICPKDADPLCGGTIFRNGFESP